MTQRRAQIDLYTITSAYRQHQGYTRKKKASKTGAKKDFILQMRRGDVYADLHILSQHSLKRRIYSPSLPIRRNAAGVTSVLR
jgi:hypothetical protein